MNYTGPMPLLQRSSTWVEVPEQLPCGWNMTAFGCDEMNGPGVNEPCSPDAFDSSILFAPTVIEGADLSVFDSCPDLRVACEPNLITIRPQPNVVCIKR